MLAPAPCVALQRMRSLAPLDNEIVPAPDHVPMSATKGPSAAAAKVISPSTAAVAAAAVARVRRVDDSVKSLIDPSRIRLNLSNGVNLVLIQRNCRTPASIRGHNCTPGKR